MEPKKLKFEELPKDIQDTLLSYDTIEKYGVIAKKYGLDENQESLLGYVSALVMYGEVRPDNFVARIQEELKVNDELGKNLGQEVNAAVFRPIINSLKKIHNIKDEEKQIYPSPLPAFQEIKRMPENRPAGTPKIPIQTVLNQTVAENPDYLEVLPPRGLEEIKESGQTDLKRDRIIEDIEKAGGKKTPQMDENKEPEYAMEDMRREDILRDLESPEPKANWQNAPLPKQEKKEMGYAPNKILMPEEKMKTVNEFSFDAHEKGETSNNVFEDRMKTIVNMPKEEINIKEKDTSVKSPPPKKYSIDPYREPPE